MCEGERRLLWMDDRRLLTVRVGHASVAHGDTSPVLSGNAKLRLRRKATRCGAVSLLAMVVLRKTLGAAQRSGVVPTATAPPSVHSIMLSTSSFRPPHWSSVACRLVALTSHPITMVGRIEELGDETIPGTTRAFVIGQQLRRRKAKADCRRRE